MFWVHVQSVWFSFCDCFAVKIVVFLWFLCCKRSTAKSLKGTCQARTTCAPCSSVQHYSTLIFQCGTYQAWRTCTINTRDFLGYNIVDLKWWTCRALMTWPPCSIMSTSLMTNSLTGTCQTWRIRTNNFAVRKYLVVNSRNGTCRASQSWLRCFGLWWHFELGCVDRYGNAQHVP